MHPLVRDLYKRVLLVGRDYPTGLDHVKLVWKQALRNPANCPSWYNNKAANNEEELLFAVHRGRHAVKEMIGVIQLKKYRGMKKRYDDDNCSSVEETMARLEEQAAKQQHQQL
jgi:hypothetical protein